jgi:uncharacterized protein (DUF433 family)
MVNPSKALYLKRKKLVIKDIDYLVDSRSKEERAKKKKNAIFNFIGLTFRKWLKDNKRKTLAQRKTPVDFLQAIENSNTEMEQMEEDIEMILVAANEDKNILEECENYIQQKYKVHLARIQSIVSVLQLIIFIAVLSILVGLLGYFPVVDIKISNVDDARIISILASVIAVATTSATVTNILMSIFKPLVVEDSHVVSTSVYEYCIELLKNAKVRTNLVLSVDPSLDRITINPRKMNGEPCIRDLRLTVWRVLELLQTYPNRSELYKQFPELTEEDIKQVMIYADIQSKDPLIATSIPHETFDRPRIATSDSGITSRTGA